MKNDKSGTPQLDELLDELYDRELVSDVMFWFERLVKSKYRCAYSRACLDDAAAALGAWRAARTANASASTGAIDAIDMN